MEALNQEAHLIPTTRRDFLGAALGLPSVTPALLRAASDQSRMKITAVEVHEILTPFHRYHANNLFRYHGLGVQLRTIYIVKTDIGLEGYGESWGPAPKDSFSRYVGSSPVDWIGSAVDLPMNMAMYDLMGKLLGVPAWKLIGPKVRSWIPVGGWTASQPPEAMAEEVRMLSQRGYRWMKYHVDVLQNAIDQTEAMQKVAPKGFKIHYDFNGNSNVDAVYPVLRELERFSIAGRFEDPIHSSDHAGYRTLRGKCRIPIVVHHAPHDFFMINHLCEGIMAGHAPIGYAMRMAAIAESTNTPFMLQQCGGVINQAFLAQEAAVFKMATIEHVSLCHLWEDDVTVERMPVVGGSVEASNKPGLGVTIDRAKLDRYTKAARPKQSRFLVRVRYSQGPTVYFRFNPDAPGANLRQLHPPHVPGPNPGYGNPVVSDFWDEEGSPAFEAMWKRTESGPAFDPN